MNVYSLGMSAYIVLLLLIGYWASRQIKTESDFLIAGRGLGTVLMVGTVCGTFWGAGIFIAGPGFAYGMGYGLLLSVIGTITSTIILIFVLAARLRKFAGMTIPDLLAARYDSQWIRVVSAIITALVGILMVTVEIYAGGVILEVVFGWKLFTGLLVISIVYVAYTVFGGFLAVAATDLIQTLVMLVGTIVAIPYILRATGGMSALHATVAQISPNHLDPFAGGFIGPSLLIAWMFIFGLGNLTPWLLQRFYGAKDQRSAVIGAALGAGLGWIFMYAVIFMGVAAFALFPGLERSDLAFPTLITGVMPPIIAVIVLTAGLGALMSTADSVLFTVGAAFSHDLYAGVINKKATDRQRLVGARIAVFFGGLAGLIASTTIIDLVYWLQAFTNAIVASGFVPVMLAAFFWPRATKQGALASMIGGSAAAIIFQRLGVPVEFLHPVYIGLAVSVVLLIAVSLATPPTSNSVLKQFFPKKYAGVSAD